MSGGPDYDLVCEAIGQRLFQKKSEEYITIEKARLEEWIMGLDAKKQAEVEKDGKRTPKEAVVAGQGSRFFLTRLERVQGVFGDRSERAHATELGYKQVDCCTEKRV